MESRPGHRWAPTSSHCRTDWGASPCPQEDSLCSKKQTKQNLLHHTTVIQWGRASTLTPPTAPEMCLFGLVGLANIEDLKDYWAGKWGRSEGTKGIKRLSARKQMTGYRLQFQSPGWTFSWWQSCRNICNNLFRQQRTVICYCGQLKMVVDTATSWLANVLSLDPCVDQGPSRWCTWPDIVGEWVSGRSLMVL